MRAYHNDHQIKANILAQLAAHRAADQLTKGWYWRDGKGCAVGCTIHSNDHAEYETRFGIPQMLARLEDCIFDGLPNEQAMAWPERFMGAIVPGSDLSRVGWQFLHWLLTESRIGAFAHPHVRDAVKDCADVLVPLKDGRPADESAANAAWGAASAAWSTAGRVESVESAAESAEYAAQSAASAASSTAESAVWAEDSANSAASSAAGESPYSQKRRDGAARSAAFIAMSNRLIALIIEVGEQPCSAPDHASTPRNLHG
jgi:hypothetical protein